jgi:regulator of protease activity HflC (stomatin/prohibitin superfamily)
MVEHRNERILDVLARKGLGKAAASGRPPMRLGVLKLIAGLAGVLVLFLLVSGSYYRVQEYERAVLTTWGKFVAVKGPGLNFKLPFVQSVRFYNIGMQSFDLSHVNTYTIDNQELNALFTVVYRIPEEAVERIYKTVPDFDARLQTLAVDRFKSEMGKVNITQVAQRRGEVREAIFTVLRDDAARLIGLQVVDFQINSIDYTDSFRAAVDLAAAAKALVEKAEQEKRQAQIEAERVRIAAEGQANAQIEAARGEAESRLLIARAEADAIRLRGEAEAAAIRAQAEALAANPRLVELRKAERWNGELPRSMLSNVVPFMSVDQNLTQP